jgi:hypothetical protein
VSVSILKKVESQQALGTLPGPDEALVRELDALAGRFDRERLLWASGYLAGLAAATAVATSGASASVSAPAVDARTAASWTVFFATETGNCRSIAEELAGRIQAGGSQVRTMDLAEFRPAQLKRETHALFVVATTGWTTTGWTTTLRHRLPWGWVDSSVPCRIRSRECSTCSVMEPS